ncbi:protein indeterminate-domain 12-like [Aristolochia californica]|uniref:protein indeterminate-domain 12-like n=1 Tax=Aristolochia californica TaxID=171875 RepID=UPI0035DF1F5B
MFPPAMSNSTSLSEEASVSSGTKLHHLPGFNCALTAISPQQQQKIKKKRNLPGNPDPDAEVMALSPKSLMATNRFVCEICNKGFQRDQNLQLHRRGHNLPWKLRQRNSKEMIRKRVFVCPEPSCVHHHPSRALGDLTGIKKHFCRKHGEKKWKCDKCSKKYAVQSDWKAHVKTCGMREYRCDCGTLFSRKDSFVTHRAFCDALAEESARLSSTPLPIRTPLASAAAIANSAVITRDSEPPALLHLTQNPSSPLLPPVFYRAPSNSPRWHAWDTQSSPLIKSEGTHFDLAFANSFNAQKQPPTSAPPLSATALLQKAATMGAVSDHAVPSSLGVHMPAIAGGRISPACLTIEGQNLDAWMKGKEGMTRDFLGLAGDENASDDVCVRELLSFTGMGIDPDSFSYERGPAMKAPTFGFQTQAWTDY